MTAPGLLTIPQVAERLRLGRTTVYRLIRGGKLPACNPTGALLRVAKADLERYIAEHPAEPRRPSDPMPRPRMRRGPRRGTFNRALEADEGGR